MSQPVKTLEVRKLDFGTDYPDLDDISERLDSLDKRNQVDILNWEDFNYKPEVEFTIAYTGTEILLKYYIKENWFKAEKTEPNQMVCEDSCVEFFVSPTDDRIYYNLEFNGIRTCLLGSGTGRENSTRAIREPSPGSDGKHRLAKKVSAKREGEFSWTITMAIPLTVFFHHELSDLKGKVFRANFYKCGDKLTVPHYVTWNPVGTVTADYHRPEFFGLLKFV